MIKRSVALSLFLLLSINYALAQGNFGIIFPKSDSERTQSCRSCLSAFQQKPKEVNFSIKNDNGSLYFHINDETWFNRLFANRDDGIAIDVVSKDIYDCEIETINTDQIRGELLRPVYASRLKSGLKAIGENSYRVLVGKLPEHLKNNELEYNILFLGNKTLCRYQIIYDIEAYRWDLLDMGIYLDSISFKNEKVAEIEDETFQLKYKTLRFKIPFEKNKTQYSSEDIKPVYDSLKLTNFNIKTINIKAYSSIEGSLERNIELQQERANSIAKAIQSYQQPNIKTTITSSENWVEFLNDIEGTKHENLKALSKSELKSKLVGSFSQEMEPYLKNHRKAVITLELERKDIYKVKSETELVDLFNSSIKDNNLDEAAQIQNSIFEKLKHNEISPDILTRLKIPSQLKYINFLNNRSAIKYQLDQREIINVRNELETLKKLETKNPRVRYNLVALKFLIWRHNIEPVNDNSFKSEIYALKSFGIDQQLIDRMMINYHIIKSEKYMRERDYKNKDKSVNYIVNAYRKVSLSDFDYFSLAQYLVYYANTDKAAELLTEKARSIDVDEDLLFYYLNLTLTNNELTKTGDYRAIMLNAINLNNNRYCNIFNAVEDGGVTFQLLANNYLRQSYCESCTN
ncbi:hypothetical protein [Winogradskyella costae]|uniref:hypothetical protein n=1 Tax=Winogradskyella costae TaxID=2697008 RepID=UPI0015C70E34|nr:hypothetical protein [Winogradskyella costae]